MSDLISRQAMIDELAELQGRASTKAELKVISKAWKRIKNLPSAQPEQPQLDGTETTVEILSELRSRFNCFDICEEPFYRALSEAIKAVSAQPEQRWIPCSERLPDIKEHYVSEPCIVCCENGAYGFAELEENIFGQVGWNCERDDEYHEPLGEVIAWMPLPKPYQAERREDDNY